jgi:hypothetical protein
MVERTRRISDRFDAFTEIEDAVAWLGGVDLIHAAGALQCVPQPLTSLEMLVALNAPFFALCRLPIWNASAIVGVQVAPLSGNGIGPMPPNILDKMVRYPVTLPNFSEVSAVMARRYQTVMAMETASGDYALPNGQIARGGTLIYHRKS